MTSEPFGFWCRRETRPCHCAYPGKEAAEMEGRALPDALELLFDDGSDDPWSLHLSPGQVDRMPLDTDSAQGWTCTVWTHLVGERCRLVLTKPTHYRRVRRLPDLRPWPA